jgi:hypothetical protein
MARLLQQREELPLVFLQLNLLSFGLGLTIARCHNA